MTELPFEYKPYLQHFQFRAFLFGMLQGQSARVMPWLCCNLMFCVGGDIADENDDRWLVDPGVIERSEHTPDYGDRRGLMQDLKEQLSRGYFVNGAVDEFYIPAKQAYQTEHFNHDYLLTGFDDERGCFISAGYTKSRSFERFEVNYDDFAAGLSAVGIPSRRMALMRLNPDYDFRFEEIALLDAVYKYIKQPFMRCYHGEKNYYGVETWLHVADTVRKIASREKPDAVVSIKLTRFLFEFRRSFLARFEYLAAEKLLIDDIFVGKYEAVVSIAERIHMAGIKYNVTKNAALLETVSGLCLRGFKEEYSLLETLLTATIRNAVDYDITDVYGK